MDVGETVVLVSDVDGMPTGKEGFVIKVRDDMLLVGCLSAERLEFVLAKSWEVPAGTQMEAAQKEKWS
jgi:hypothetical protein